MLKALFATLSATDPARSSLDIDLDMKLATLLGFNGQMLRNIELRLSGRGGEVRELTLAATLGNDADVKGEMSDDRDGRRVIHLQGKDAGSLLRFINVYPWMRMGRMRMAVYVSDIGS